jgi:hypothetical protein
MWLVNGSLGCWHLADNYASRHSSDNDLVSRNDANALVSGSILHRVEDLTRHRRGGNSYITRHRLSCYSAVFVNHTGRLRKITSTKLMYVNEYYLTFHVPAINTASDMEKVDSGHYKDESAWDGRDTQHVRWSENYLHSSDRKKPWRTKTGQY